MVCVIWKDGRGTENLQNSTNIAPFYDKIPI